MKTNLFKVLAMGIAMLCSSNATFAKQYCSEPLTNGTNTVYLTCQKLSEGNYQILIEGERLTGLGGSYVNANGVGGYYLNGDHQSVAADGTSITCNISSTTDPTFYTPLYVIIEGVGEVNFGQPSDIEWGVCGNIEDDTEKPIMGTAEIIGAPTHNTVQIKITGATDNVGVVSYHVVDETNSYNTTSIPVEDIITLNNLNSNTTYNLTITAKDLAGNESENSATVTLTTTSFVYYNFPTGQQMDAEWADPNGRILLTIQKESSSSVSFMVSPNNEGTVIDFVAVLIAGKEYNIGSVGGNSVAGQKITVTDLTSLSFTVDWLQWHTTSMDEAGRWSTGTFTVNESELYNAGQSTNTTIEMDTKCSVYPNPVADVLNIQAADKIAMATVFNLMGQQILTVNPDTESVKIDCSALTKGSYMLSLVFANGQKATYKIVK